MADFNIVVEALEKFEAEIISENPFITKYSINKLVKGLDACGVQLWDLTVDLELNAEGKGDG